MSDALAQATNAPVTFTWRETVWRLGGLRLRHRAELRTFVADYILRRYEDAKAMMQARDAPPEHLEILREELRQARRRPLRSDFADEHEPLAYGIWLRLQPQHPGLCLTTVMEMADDPDIGPQLPALCHQADSGDDLFDKWCHVVAIVGLLTHGERAEQMTDAEKWQAFTTLMADLLQGDEPPPAQDAAGNPPDPSPATPTGNGSSEVSP